MNMIHLAVLVIAGVVIGGGGSVQQVRVVAVMHMVSNGVNCSIVEVFFFVSFGSARLLELAVLKHHPGEERKHEEVKDVEDNRHRDKDVVVVDLFSHDQAFRFTT